MNAIGILGAGAWGTALALSAARAGGRAVELLVGEGGGIDAEHGEEGSAGPTWRKSGPAVKTPAICQAFNSAARSGQRAILAT